MFASENELTTEFERTLARLFRPGQIGVWKQLRGIVGIPDFVLLDREPQSRIVVAVELKMSNWKRALIQAYKYRAFAHMSMVLMDADRSGPALNNIHFFAKYNVGLATLNRSGAIKIYSFPDVMPPFSISMHKKFQSIVGTDGCNIKNNWRKSAIQVKLSSFCH